MRLDEASSRAFFSDSCLMLDILIFTDIKIFVKRIIAIIRDFFRGIDLVDPQRGLADW